MKKRGFEIAQGWENCDIELPRRSTAHAAGYDIAAATDLTIPAFRPGTKPTLIPTGLKAYCQPDECYYVFNRSSGAGKGIVLANGVGVIDADYYGNPKNDGHFQVLVFNVTDHDLKIHKGDRIAQVIFQKFLTVDCDDADGQRTGGFGSTDDVPKPIRIIYDLDDVLWDLTHHVMQRAGLGDKTQTDYLISQDAAFTPSERAQVIAAFSDPDNFKTTKFYPGADEIMDFSAPNVEICVNSNSYSEEVSAMKRQRLRNFYPLMPIECLQINLVTPDSNYKSIGSDVLVFIDDSPYNIATSKAQFNLMPHKSWNTTSAAQRLAIGENKTFVKTWRRNLPKFLATGQKYVIPVQDLHEVNEFVRQIIKLKQGESK